MSESKKELIEEHKRLTYILKDGSLKERLEEYERQMKELKKLLATGKYEPEVIAKTKVETSNPKYKGNHYVRLDGNWHRLINMFVDKPRSEEHGFSSGSNWYHLEGHPEGVVHQTRIAADPESDYVTSKEQIAEVEKQRNLTKSNYGPKGAGLYDSTVNQKRKAKNVDQIEGVGQNKNVKVYTSASQGTAKEQAANQAKKDLEVNKLQPVKTMADLTPEEKAALEAQYSAKKSEDAPPAYEHKTQQYQSQKIPDFLRRIAVMESTGGKNKEHAEVKVGVHKGTSSVSTFGLMPKLIKEVAEKYKPLKNSMLGKLILSSDVKQVNDIVSNHEHDSELANHVWNYNQSRLSQHAVDPSHLEALGVAAHRRGITGALKLYKEGGINAVHSDPYVNKYNKIKENEIALEKANAKLQLLRSALEKAIQEKPLDQLLMEIRTRQPTNAEINRIIGAQVGTSVDAQDDIESKAAADRYRLACEDVE